MMSKMTKVFGGIYFVLCLLACFLQYYFVGQLVGGAYFSVSSRFGSEFRGPLQRIANYAQDSNGGFRICVIGQLKSNIFDEYEIYLPVSYFNEPYYTDAGGHKTIQTEKNDINIGCTIQANHSEMISSTSNQVFIDFDHGRKIVIPNHNNSTKNVVVIVKNITMYSYIGNVFLLCAHIIDFITSPFQMVVFLLVVSTTPCC